MKIDMHVHMLQFFHMAWLFASLATDGASNGDTHDHRWPTDQYHTFWKMAHQLLLSKKELSSFTPGTRCTNPSSSPLSYR